MAAPPVVFHQQKHAHPDLHHKNTASARLPVIPDLRFEHSYLRSIQPYVHVERLSTEDNQSRPTDVGLIDRAILEEEGFETLDTSLGKEGESVLVQPPAGVEAQGEPRGPSEIIRIQWKNVAWVTVRDQVISPLLQGALWALASYYVRPFSAELGSRMGTFVHGHIPKKEGSAVSWLRNWAKTIGLTSGNSNSNNIQRTSK